MEWLSLEYRCRHHHIRQSHYENVNLQRQVNAKVWN